MEDYLVSSKVDEKHALSLAEAQEKLKAMYTKFDPNSGTWLPDPIRAHGHGSIWYVVEAERTYDGHLNAGTIQSNTPIMNRFQMSGNLSSNSFHPKPGGNFTQRQFMGGVTETTPVYCQKLEWVYPGISNFPEGFVAWGPYYKMVQPQNYAFHWFYAMFPPPMPAPGLNPEEILLILDVGKMISPGNYQTHFRKDLKLKDVWNNPEYLTHFSTGKIHMPAVDALEQRIYWTGKCPFAFFNNWLVQPW